MSWPLSHWRWKKGVKARKSSGAAAAPSLPTQEGSVCAQGREAPATLRPLTWGWGKHPPRCISIISVKAIWGLHWIKWVLLRVCSMDQGSSKIPKKRILHSNKFVKPPLLFLESVGHSVMSNSLQLLGLQPSRLLCPQNSPGQNTGVGSHSLLQGIFPTQELNWGLPELAGRFFTIWATRKETHNTHQLIKGTKESWTKGTCFTLIDSFSSNVALFSREHTNIPQGSGHTLESGV